MEVNIKQHKIEEILDSALLVGGQIPTIFWDLDITGKELRVLNYVWGNIVRLYATVNSAPKGKNGVIQFWEKKESMAQDCKMSNPTFRNAVRSLSKLGLVTSMDRTKSIFDDSQHFVSLDNEFFDGKNLEYMFDVDKSSIKYKIHLLLDIIPQLYDKTVVKLAHENFEKMFKLECSEKSLNNIISKLKVLDCKFSDKVENGKVKATALLGYSVEVLAPVGYKDVYTEDGWIKARKLLKPLSITVSRDALNLSQFRVSLKMPRKKVDIEAQRKLENMSKSERLIEKAKEFRDKNYVLSSLESKVMDVAHYYEYKCRVVTGVTGWKCLGKNFRQHRNWKFLHRIYEMCENNGWDYKVYIDAQFDRASYWQHNSGVKYPYLNQFFSDKAVKYFKNYVKFCKEKNSPEGNSKVKSSVPQSYIQDIADSIVKDCDNYLCFMKYAHKRKYVKDMTPEQVKLSYILDHVMTLSPYYWASLPWSVDYLKGFDNPMVKEVIEKVVAYQKSKAIMAVIHSVIAEVEKAMGIVPTVLPQ